MIPLNGSIGSPRLSERGDLVKLVLRMQYDGWQDALASDLGLTVECDERYLNNRLFEGMESVRNRLNLNNLFIAEQPKVRTVPGPAGSKGEPDIGIYFSEFSANASHALIECKRIGPQRRPSDLRRQYVVSGMDRFISGSYGADHELDFMVGYILSGSPVAAIADINDYLRRDRARDRLGICSRFNSFGCVACSGHLRGNGIIQLLHGFLTFPPKAGANRMSNSLKSTP